MLPSKSLKLPSVSETTKCVTENFTLECDLSSVHFMISFLCSFRGAAKFLADRSIVVKAKPVKTVVAIKIA